MTVSELIKLLQAEDPDSDVHFQHGSGDYWKTKCASEVHDVVTGEVEWSEYHRNWTVPRTEIDLEDPPEKFKAVVLLK